MTHSYTSTESWTYTYTNLGQVCLFSNLITNFFGGVSFELLSWEHSFGLDQLLKHFFKLLYKPTVNKDDLLTYLPTFLLVSSLEFTGR